MSNTRSIVIGDRKIGDGLPCFVTFEAGPTHAGLESAKRLSLAAKTAGADAVKFQITQPDRLVADRSVTISYEVLANRKTGEQRTITESLYDVLSRRYLTAEEWIDLKKYCDEIGILFFATASFMDNIQMLVDFGCDTIKIASVDVVNLPFLREVAEIGLAIQLDTGNATLGEIEAAVDAITSTGNNRILIHHCPSGYPAHLESINLRIIDSLRRLFPFPIAFSDHSPGWEMDVAALAMGANVLEKTITEDRMTPSIEHVFSLEPSDAAAFIETVRKIEIALGNTRRYMTDEEKTNRLKFRRSPYLVENAVKGTVLSELSVEFRRPGVGLTANLLEQLPENAMLRVDLPAGHCLSLKDIEW